MEGFDIQGRCISNVFNIHDRFYYKKGYDIVPTNYTGFDVDPLAQFGLSPNDLTIYELHYNSNCVDFGLGSTPCTSPVNGIGITNPNFDNKLQAALITLGLNANDVIVTTDGTLYTFWVSPSLLPDVGNLSFFYGNPTLFLGKFGLENVTKYVAGDDLCIPIHEVDLFNQCENLTTYRFEIKNGSGSYVPVTDIIPTFLESDVVSECPCDEEIQVFETETCGYINGSSDVTEIIRVYTRNKYNGNLEIIKYEDNLGKEIIGTVVETCCSCLSNCSNAPSANRRCLMYGSFLGASKMYIDMGTYDTFAGSVPCPIPAVREVWQRVRVFDDANILVSTTVIGGYVVNGTVNNYTNMLNDVNTIVSSFGVTLAPESINIGNWGGVQIDYADGVYFGITFEEGFADGSGGVCWNVNVRRAIKYDATLGEPKNSINFGNLTDIADASWDFANSNPNTLCTTI